MNHKVYLGIDFGKKKIGIAKSDPTGLIASPVKTIVYKSINKAIEEIIAQIDEYQIDAVVVGYPVAPDGGTKGERCQMVDSFIERFRKSYDGEIILCDERHSSNMAEDIIHMHDKKIGKNKARIDRLAAAIILQRFLDER